MTRVNESYPPYETADESDAAYAGFVSDSHAKILQKTGLSALNVHYGERLNGKVQDRYSGRWFWDCHRNGSKFNLGHRHPAILKVMRDALDHLDAGSFSQLTSYRAMAAEKLAASTGGALSGVVFGVGGADAVEIAVHAARNATGRRHLVAISDYSYHGGTDLGLSLSGNCAETRERYLVPDHHVTHVPYNDLEAMVSALTSEVAAVVIEPTPAQGGFPEPAPGYLAGVKAACEAVGALMILDDVQTGLGGLGTMWGYEPFEFTPDVLVTGKGLGAGMYPISAALMSEPVWRAYTERQFVAHESTYAGSDIGCVIAAKVVDITTDPAFLAHVRQLAERFAAGFADAPYRVSQTGLCMGLWLDDPVAASALLAREGVLTLPSADAPVVPFRPILTLSEDDADDIIRTVRKALG